MTRSAANTPNKASENMDVSAAKKKKLEETKRLARALGS